MSGDELKTVQTKLGSFVVFTHDVFITRCLEAHGELSPSKRFVLEQMAPPGATVVEVGSNIGVHTVAMARRCHPGTLLAFEPQQRVFQALCANLALNGVTNVIARPVALGEQAGVAAFPPVSYGRPGNFGGVELSADALGERVEIITLDSLGLTTCALLKIDVEGFELAVLRGARETIKRLRPRIYIENDRKHQQALLIQELDSMGYRLHWHHPPLVSDAIKDNVLGQRIISNNMLCLPKESGTVVNDMPLIDPKDWPAPTENAAQLG